MFFFTTVTCVLFFIENLSNLCVVVLIYKNQEIKFYMSFCYSFPKNAVSLLASKILYNKMKSANINYANVRLNPNQKARKTF